MNVNIIFNKSYVDDILLYILEDKIDYILNSFNKNNNFIKFTNEEEIKNSTNFLDLTITHHKEKIYTKRILLSQRQEDIKIFISTTKVTRKVSSCGIS